MRQAALLPPLVFVLLFATTLHAQTIDDGIMLAKHDLYTGNLYTHDAWDEYWEGSLKRNNGNIGTLTTQTNSIFVNYGITERLNAIASVPHVWTSASQGVLHSMSGFQDIALAAKYRFFEKSSTPLGLVRAMGVVSAGLPLTDYTPDFYPLSIGSASKRVGARLTLHVHTGPGWFATGTTSYTWRAAVTLDRPYYYTDGRLYLTDRVEMPNVSDYTVTGGYMKGGLMAAAFYSEQRTLGGGDIRRQDMPFVSNRMNFSKVGASVIAPLPKLGNFAIQFGYAYTVDGRNVGQSATFTTGVVYRLQGRPAQ